MSDTPIVIDQHIDPLTATFTISRNPSQEDVLKLMDVVSQYLTSVAVNLLQQKKGDRPLFPPIHPATNTLIQACQVLQNGCAQLEMLRAQQGGQMLQPQAMPRRMN